ncbi:MAG: molybdenum cofactor biosynthesis protein MoaE [Gemmatimonadota bacterium]|nr:MAG: molybdenum cofactor biosynthesis protein MoaE [Gemmatimonadota bacterium]
MGYCTHEPIEVGRLMAAVADGERGGTVAFVGSVRGGAEDGPVVAIEYSAYEEMVAEEFGRIIAEARERWPEAVVAAQHRLGQVPLGEPSIAVVAAAPHRREAFAACRHVVEEAKRRLPVWKKEQFQDGGTRWREH